MKCTVMTRLAITGFLLFLSACGGGGGGSGGNPYITVNSVTMTPTTIPVYGVITLTWDVSYDTPARLSGQDQAVYGVDVFLSKDTVLDDYTKDVMLTARNGEVFHDNKVTATYNVIQPVGWFGGVSTGEWYVIVDTYLIPMIMKPPISFVLAQSDKYVVPQKLTVTN